MDVHKIAPEYRGSYLKDVLKSDLKESGKVFAAAGITVGAVALTRHNKPVADLVQKAYNFVSKPKFVQNFITGTKGKLKKVLSPEVISRLKNTGTAGKLAAVLLPITALVGLVGIGKSYYNTGKIAQQYIDKSNAQ